jgi:hypothetical protein
MSTAEKDVDLLRRDIIDAMTKIENPQYRITLALVLRILDSQDRLIHEMFAKIDTLIKDEKRLQSIVLNGHVDKHTEHHDWLEKNLIDTDNLRQVIELAEDHAKHDGLCEWAAQKKREEDESVRANKKTFRGILEKLLYAGLVFLIGFHFNNIKAHFEGLPNANSSISNPNSN